MTEDEKREFYKELRERIKQLRMHYLKNRVHYTTRTMNNTFSAAIVFTTVATFVYWGLNNAYPQ